MPTYDYECTKCGHTFDVLQNMSDNPLTTCPECGKRSLRRLIGGGLGVIFKGSGFYVTDSRSSSRSSTSPKKEEKKSEPVAAGSKSETSGAGTSPSSDKSSSGSSSSGKSGGASSSD